MWDSIVYRLSALEGAYNTVNQNHETLKARHSDLADAHYRLAHSNPKPAAQEPKIPDPPLYDGDRKELLAWLAKCEMKFEGNPSKFVDLRTKLLYVGTRLEGTAFTWFQPLMKKWSSNLPVEHPDVPPELKSWKAFADAITEVFGDPNLAATAEREIVALRQLSSVADYAAKFESKRQYLGWNDPALRDQFYRGLKEEIKDQIAPVGKPATLALLKELAVRLDARLFERKLETKPPKNETSKPTPRPQNQSFLAPPPWGAQAPQARPPAPSAPTPAHSAAAPPTTPNFPAFTADGTVPMEIGTNGVWQVTAAEKQRRRLLKLCDYCASNQHAVDNCPIRPPRRYPQRSRFNHQAVMAFELQPPSSNSEKGSTEE
jgi:hypothetical protein